MQNNFTKLINNLNELSLFKISNNIENYITAISNGNISIVDALYELTNLEIDLKHERAMNACVKVANFPFIKTFDDFDFSFQPSINKDQILNFKYLSFIGNKENIIFIGTPGVGKTHLATSIGIEAAKQRTCTYFISCNDLVLQLKRARIENRLEQRIKFFSKYKLLIIDEVGFLPLDVESSNLFFLLLLTNFYLNGVRYLAMLFLLMPSLIDYFITRMLLILSVVLIELKT